LYLSLMLPFRPGHPPLLIPWRDIREVGRRRYRLRERVVVEIGSPSLATVTLPMNVFQARDVPA